jgi:hypothetical protein
MINYVEEANSREVIIRVGLQILIKEVYLTEKDKRREKSPQSTT